MNAIVQRRLIVRMIFLAAAATAAAAALLIYASQGEAQEPLPGLLAGVSALDTLPPAANVPPDVVETLKSLDPSDVGEPAAAAKKLRRLRSNVGTAKRDLYAFRSPTGAVCFVMEEHSALCPSALTAGSPGLLWTIGGGTEKVPGALAAIAADPVTAVELRVDDKAVPVSLANNAAFAELPSGGHEAVIVVHYRDTRSETINVGLD
jgi:hypothetical protein